MKLIVGQTLRPLPPDCSLAGRYQDFHLVAFILGTPINQKGRLARRPLFRLCRIGKF
jgi:hypothetical protein